MPTVIHLEDYKAAATQVRELLGESLAHELISYRDDGPTSKRTPWERAYSAGVQGASDHKEEIHAALTSKEVLIRAYHATRVSNQDVLRQEGLKMINPETIGSDLLRLAEAILGKPVPRRAIDDWRKAIGDPSSYLTLRKLSVGPVFAYGYKAAYQLRNMGRYFLEGGEVLGHITPSLVQSIKRYEPSFTLSADEFHAQYRKLGIPTLVVCELPYDEMIAEKQEWINIALVRALVFKPGMDDEEGRFPGGWQGGWDEISVDRDVPPIWIRDLMIPTIRENTIAFPKDPATA